MYPIDYIEHEDHLKWEEFFTNLSYKPNWEFDYKREVERGLSKVVMTMRVPDARRPVPRPVSVLMGARQNIPLIPITKSVVLPRFHGEQFAKEYIHFHIRDMEEHEIGEWFRYKGELVFDPHKE